MANDPLTRMQRQLPRAEENLQLVISLRAADKEAVEAHVSQLKEELDRIRSARVQLRCLEVLMLLVFL
ncbi:hypothetical protein LXL04_003313 [Taraxacum kok-saghyz]